MGTNPLTIGRLARRAGVNVETVRYYERRGLLPEPPRTRAGYRMYAPDSARRIAFIKRAQALGFTLEEIRELFALRVHRRTNCAVVERQALDTMARIDAKIDQLRRMRRVLGELALTCQSRRSTDDCPILVALEADRS